MSKNDRTTGTEKKTKIKIERTTGDQSTASDQIIVDQSVTAVSQDGRIVDWRRKNVRWPKICRWPAPICEYGGFDWDEDTIPFELNDYGQELVDIKDYFDQLVEEGRLDENYYFNEDYEDPFADDDEEDDSLDTDDEWFPEQGDEFWDEDHFDIDYWRDELSATLNSIKIEACEDDPTNPIYEILGYRFINENLLRQAFTRRAFQIEYGLSGCSEELEFLGDSILSLLTSKELARHFAEVNDANTDAPFESKIDEGGLSRLKSTFVCKEHLAKRCEELGLDQFILYGTGEIATESAKEDAIEALIGAAALDCSWDMDVLEQIVDCLVSMQIDQPERYLKKSYYELFNAWHMSHFGVMPEYTVYKRDRQGWLDDSFYECMMAFYVPGMDKQFIKQYGESRSKARERAAEYAYEFVVNNGCWMNLKDAEIVPSYDEGINQLQELFQKKYIEKPEYEFNEERGHWTCNCVVEGIVAFGKGNSKTLAKKQAAYEAVVLLLKSAGCCKDEWMNEMFRRKWQDTSFKEEPEAQPEKKGPVKIEAKYKGGIKYTAVAEILEQIEPGKIITEKVLVEWVKKVTGMDTLIINWKEFPYPHLREESIPFHRFLTSKGLVEEYYKDQLIEEGHDVVLTKTTNWRVLDYKETMVDVEKLVLPEDSIGPEGSFLANVRADVKDMLMEQMAKKK